MAVTFDPANNFKVDSVPLSVTVGDFDGDGNSDLAVANHVGNNVSVLSGDGSGSFSVAQNFAVGDGADFVIVGDFNGDNNQDLAVANIFDNNISVLLGDGNGSFGTAQDFNVGSRPNSLTVGDFNGDNIEDLAVANQFSNNVSVLIGDGTGSFGTAQDFNVGLRPSSVTVGDFNGDNIEDLAVTNLFDQNVSVLLGDGSGSFGTAQNFNVGILPSSVTVGDFNADGNSDLAVANQGVDTDLSTNNVSVLLGDGSGSFGTAQNFDAGSAPRSITIADFNGDGNSDLAVANRDSDNVSILIGDGSGSFDTAQNFNVGSKPSSVTVGDFNGDNIQDLAVANALDNNVSVLLNTTPLANLVISEIMYNPSSSEDNWEWIEVYNSRSVTVDLSGYVIDDNNNVAHTTANIASGSIEAGETAILYNADDVSAADFEAAWGTGINLIAVTNWQAMPLNNDGDQVSLWSSFADYSGDNVNHANAIDTVNYEDGSNDWPNDNGSASIYLTDLSANNNDGANWALSTDGGATPAGVGYMSVAAGGNSGSDVGSPVSINKIEGTMERDTLTGTSAKDIITGFQGRDILTGGGGADHFVYTSHTDARDTITDFEVGSDKIDLTQLLDSLGYTGSDPIGDGYISFGASGNDALVQVDRDGNGSSFFARTLVSLENVTVAEINNSNNFIF